ncbi:MAG: YncE family protein [Hyphomonadaceae bacterium]|jgi:DNA-binding beta-propeller fold protein YncE|nr:YncE family protein [Hyphomonadaceae bacterium]
MRGHTRAAVLAAVLAVGSAAAQAQLAVSANDAKVKLVNGKVEVVKSPPADTISIIDLRSNPPKVLAELDVPNSVVGPPSNVAVSPKEDIVLVAGAMQIDPADAAKTVADDKLTVIDIAPLKPGILKRLGLSKGAAPAPKVIATLQAGKGAAGVAINKAGSLALVANRSEGTVSVFTIKGTTLTAAGKVTVGGDKSGPSAIAFTPDGKSALLTLDSDNKIVVLSVDGAKVELTKRTISAGLRPYGLDIAAKGEVAVVANIGLGGGDADTISVIDLKLNPPRVVNTYTVGQTPEGIKMSPDGKYVAVTVMNGSNKPSDSPFFNPSSILQVWARNGTQLSKSAELPIGKWCQGIAWSSNSRTLLVQCMVEEEITVVRYSGLTGRSLQKVGTIKAKGGPAGIGTAQP